MDNTTIAAISTPLGSGGIAVIRISGEKAIDIADKVFKGKKKLKELKGYTAQFGHVYNKDILLDECVATVFTAPHSFTGENVAELSLHGGEYVVKKVLETLYKKGAVPAKAGEFSYRAFINGKIDLTEAESIMEIISAKNERALTVAERNKQGAITKKINTIKDDLLGLIAKISVWCDYPDDESMEIDESEFLSVCENIKNELTILINSFNNGKLLKNGINTVIVGKPNVGKSTLMNMLSKEDLSIVTSIPGTTRDVVETTINLNGYTFNISDTAGIRETENEVEKIGVERALKRVKNADLLLMLFETGEILTQEDAKLLLKYKEKTVAVINKTDLEKNGKNIIEKTEKTEEFFKKNNVPYVKISAKENIGEEELINVITKTLKLIDTDSSEVILGSFRQKTAAENALNLIENAIGAIKENTPADAYGVLLDEALAYLLELTGERVTNEVADRVFKDFCVGK